MRSTLAFALLATAGLSAAQEQYTIDPSDVSQSDRDYWCDQQKSMCPLICLQQPGVNNQNTVSNDCDPDALTYNCVCDNGVSPNITQYTQTLPYFICTEWGNECVAQCNNDNSCQDSCRADHPCGAKEPFKGNATASASKSAGASKTADQTVPVTGFAGQTDSSEPGAASSTLNLGASYGMALTFVGVFVGFALL